MKRLLAFWVILCFAGSHAFCQQQGITSSGRGTGQPPFPVLHYKELPNPIPANLKDWKGFSGVRVSWGATNIRYKKEKPFPSKKEVKKIKLYGWKGERVAAQWVASNYGEAAFLSYEVSDLINGKDTSKKIGRKQLLSGFVRYVMTDELDKDGKSGCANREDHSKFDSSLVADVIDQHTDTLPFSPMSTRSGWVSIWIPRNAEAGTYEGSVTVSGEGKVIQKLKMIVEVGNHKLPKPNDWTFHLDLWQNPFAVARYYQVKPWSKAHFEHLREDMKHYANAGGDVITTSIIHKPWDGQTYDDFETMITWMKKADDTWYFDYTVFDKWVEFMMSLGVDKQINCYSMIPWKLSFQYYDQATNSFQYFSAKPGDSAYAEFWGTMLKSFAKHLKKKGWFDKTYISMDERSQEDMLAALAVIKHADKNFKVALAGFWHPDLSGALDDYSIFYGQKFGKEVLKRRHDAGQISTFYTSCGHPYPNSFTFSPPAQSEWLAWYAAEQHLDGFLRWAYNSWVIEPLLDSRFVTWSAGDPFLVYPGGRTSVRFEKLVAGIQQYEKIHILREAFKKEYNEKGLERLNNILKPFKELQPQKESAKEKIIKAKKALRKLYRQM